MKYTIILILLPLVIMGQSLDESVTKVLLTFNYGKDYCYQVDSLIEVVINTGRKEEAYELYGLKGLCMDPVEQIDSILILQKLLSKASSPRSEGLNKSIEAQIQESRGDNERAIQTYTESLSLYDKKRDVEFIIITNLAISWLHYGVFSFDTAAKYAKIGYALSKDQNNQFGMIDALDNLANCYGRLGQIEKSDSTFQEYLSLSRSMNNPTVTYWSSCAAGNSFEFKGNHDSASIHFDIAYNTALLLNDTAFQLEALLYKGENAQRRGESSLAIESLEKVKEFPKRYQRAAVKRRVNEYLSEAYAAQGNFTEAYNYLLKYKQIQEDNWNEENRKLTQDYEAKYQSLQKDNEIAQQNLIISRSNMQRNIVAAGAIGLGLLVWFLFYRSRKNQNIALGKIKNLENQQKLVALDYMVQGQEEERKRIAQDLHDGLGGLLSTARLQLQKVHAEIEKLSEHKVLDKAGELIDDACMEVRRIAHDMMPSALMDLGLIEALEDLSYHLSEKNAITIDVRDNTTHLMLTDIQKVQLYRTIQEILSNALKHSNANSLMISIDKSEKELKIQIKDDGRGFDYPKVLDQGGLGLKNIKSRIQYLNGMVRIKTALNKGTTYFLSIQI